MLIDLYRKRTTYDIALLTGFTQGSVSNVMRRLGVTRRMPRIRRV
jgi:hypothetical protein